MAAYVYIITPVNDPKARAYVGKTTRSPLVRLREHNGEVTGGAKRTRKLRPWRLACVISGFKDETDALKVEWALQHPYKSTLTRVLLTTEMKGKRGVGATWSLKRKLAEIELVLKHLRPDLSLEIFE